MKLSRREIFLIAFLILTILALGVFFALQNKRYFDNKSVAVFHDTAATLSVANGTLSVPQKLSNPPEIIKAVYVTGYSAGTKRYLNYLTDLFKNTEINSVVVDIKGSDGVVSYPGRIKEIDALIRFFHDQNIYVIGRIAVFEDPVYSKARPELAVYNKSETTDLLKPVLWQDNNKLSWLDPTSKDVWDYNISLAKDALYHGFDEINFDYVRFPSDGKTENMGFPVWDGKTLKADNIKDFFQYLRSSLAGEKISVDLFGQTTTNTDDMGIGQIIENAFENFDYVSPMVYPSHYINGFMGFINPADHPYEIINYSMATALSREKSFSVKNQVLAAEPTDADLQPAAPIADIGSLAKLRPWLQDFNMGAIYTADMVRAEIKATQDSLGGNYSGFMLWNPSSIYNQEAVLKPN